MRNVWLVWLATTYRYPGSFYDESNLWTLCTSFNTSKGDATVEEWRAAVERRQGIQPQAPPRFGAVIATEYTRRKPRIG